MLKNTFKLVLGNLIEAIATVCFIIPNKLVCGGLSGIAVVLGQFIPLSEKDILNYTIFIVFLLAIIFLGIKYASRIVFSMFLYPFFNQLVSMTGLIYDGNRFIAAILSGVLVAIGITMLCQAKSAAGGTDVIVYIVNKYTHIPNHKLFLAIDGTVLLSGLIVYGLVDICYGLLAIVCMSNTIKLLSKEQKDV